MAEVDNRQIVERLWRAFDARDFDAAGECVHEDVVCDWPQSRERIRGRANFVAVNRNYPGDWAMTVRRVIVAGDEAASEVEIRIDGRTEMAVSFYELRDGKIARATLYYDSATFLSQLGLMAVPGTPEAGTPAA